MKFEPVHIHSTRRSSYNHLILLLIPALIFLAIMSYLTLRGNIGQVSGVSTRSGLTESVK